jgi:hypothetical protein
LNISAISVGVVGWEGFQGWNPADTKGGLSMTKNETPPARSIKIALMQQKPQLGAQVEERERVSLSGCRQMTH